VQETGWSEREEEKMENTSKAIFATHCNWVAAHCNANAHNVLYRKEKKGGLKRKIENKSKAIFATHCNWVATHCNIPQHTATH